MSLVKGMLISFAVISAVTLIVTVGADLYREHKKFKNVK